MALVKHPAPVLAFALIVLIASVFGRGPISQPLAYHDFADARSFLGIPNAWNVLSNLPFALVGLIGIRVVATHERSREMFKIRWERWPYVVLFAGVVLTTIGSGYYHLAPDNARLVWDRIPMTFGFMGLLTALLAERVGLRVGRVVFGPLVVLGVGSVVYWHWSEIRGYGDLRLYLLVQFGSLALVLLLVVLYPSRYRGTKYLVLGLGAYAGAKWLEVADSKVYAVGRVVSGHTLKHLVAAGGVVCLITMLTARVRVPRRSAG